jgi:hypothetical protein
MCCDLSSHTFPSMQGTLAKRTKPALQSNFAKEPFRPSRSNTGVGDSAKMIDTMNENINFQCLTHGRVHMGLGSFQRFMAHKISWCTRISYLHEIPYDTLP